MPVPKSLQNFSKTRSVSDGLFQIRRYYYFGGFKLNEDERLLLCRDRLVNIKSKDLDVLLVLLRNSSRLVTKAQLMDEVWPNSFVSEANLGVHIACLRKALRENSPDSSYIETVTRYGYRFVGEVSVINESGADTTVLDLERDQSQPILCPDTTEATFLVGDGLRLEMRKENIKTEILMTIPESGHAISRDTTQNPSGLWEIQKDGVVISAIRANGKRYLKITIRTVNEPLY